MNGGRDSWLDGYGDDAEDLDDLAAEAPAASEPAPAPAIGPVLACRHCQSPRIGPASSSGDSTAIKFRCAVCGKMTTHRLPYGYRKVYVANEPESR